MTVVLFATRVTGVAAAILLTGSLATAQVIPLPDAAPPAPGAARATVPAATRAPAGAQAPTGTSAAAAPATPSADQPVWPSGPVAPASPPPPPAPTCKVWDAELQVSYQGGCKDGYAEGHGVARGASGAYYNGTFKGGSKEGLGRKVYANGDEYNGGWVFDAREGSGTYIFGEASPWRGDRSEGLWVADKRHGKGVYIFAPDNIRMETNFFGGAPIDPAPPAMVQRQRAMKVLLPVIGVPGTRVCSITTQGATSTRIARGVVTNVLDDRLQVNITTPETLSVSVSKMNPRWDNITEWMPCK